MINVCISLYTGKFKGITYLHQAVDIQCLYIPVNMLTCICRLKKYVSTFSNSFAGNSYLSRTFEDGKGTRTRK